MKVVLFCGGMGLRIRDAENVPKPLVQIGYRPVLWHVMKYYAHYGHKDFILCLGYGADAIKRYFLDYSECASNDFVLSQGGRKVELFNSDIHDWRITFAVFSTSSASSNPVIFVSPTASAPKISARWEIDLSPGTTTVPRSGPERRAAKEWLDSRLDSGTVI